jgi:ribosomal protein S18 acetylase RimI-like enzyme
VKTQRAAYGVEADLIRFDAIPPLHETETDVMGLDLTILAVVEDERVLAVVGYRRSGAVVDIDRLAVSPDRFRQGLGRQLLRTLHEREKTATRFVVSTSRDNEPALRLYESVGYSAVADVVVAEGLVVRKLERRRRPQ